MPAAQLPHADAESHHCSFSTQKHHKFTGAKLLLVQPLNLDNSPRDGGAAVDGVGAGMHEKVLGGSRPRRRRSDGQKAVPVDAAIVESSAP